MAKTFFISDLHLEHKNVIEYCHRPFASLDKMHTEIVKRWNAVVDEDDCVYVLGDFALGKYRDVDGIACGLKGKKILVIGNHDKYTVSKYLELGFSAVVESAEVRLSKNIVVKLSHYPHRPSILRRAWLSLNGRKIRGCELKSALKADGRWLLHGHTHSMKKINSERREIHVGCDAWNFTPIPKDKILGMIESAEREKELIDKAIHDGNRF